MGSIQLKGTQRGLRFALRLTGIDPARLRVTYRATKVRGKSVA